MKLSELKKIHETFLCAYSLNHANVGRFTKDIKYGSTIYSINKILIILICTLGCIYHF
jgi:hypothetical protein